MRATPTPWPNGLGYDVGRVQVFTGKGNERATWTVTFGNGKTTEVDAPNITDGFSVSYAVKKARIKLLVNERNQE